MDKDNDELQQEIPQAKIVEMRDALKSASERRDPECCIIEGGCMNQHHHGYRCNAGCELAQAYWQDSVRRSYTKAKP